MPNYKFEPEKYKKELKAIITDLLKLDDPSEREIDKIIRKYPMDGNKVFSRDKIVAGIEWMNLTLPYPEGEGLRRLIDKIKLKPMRTMSGVTTVTVLTKPFFCPGACVFCPNDVRMPKSYIATEPGAQRALMNKFSPYLQTYNRLLALKNIGHPTAKIELLVLGGTWSSYPKNYQIWFIRECFRAMNDFSEGKKNTEDEIIQISDYLKHDYNEELRAEVGDLSYNKIIKTDKFQHDFSKYIAFETRVTWEELEAEHEKNASSNCRCVGLVLETRPDSVNFREAENMRRLGATKIQLGIQTLDDEISKMNKRGEDRVDTSRAFNILRLFGFKIHAHIMPNLYGATPEGDLRVYKELFENENYKPDEVKIYPTSIIKNTELYDLYLAGKYTPYSVDTLTTLIAKCMEMTPEYCRLTRIIRDIPSTEIEAGNKTTNLRQVVELYMKRNKMKNPNIRAREIKNRKVEFGDLRLEINEYETKYTTEYFLQYITEKREIAGFLRLSLPNSEGAVTSPRLQELQDCAMIREVHVYGPSLKLSAGSTGEAQHLGLGTKLIEKAKELTRSAGYEKLAVISAIGTREYYEKRNFVLKGLYQVCEL